MNLLLATVIVIIAMCDAEPPRFRHFQRQSVQPSNADAPYPAAGYRPAGAQFTLPQRQQTYGPPPQTYGPPNTDTEQPQNPEVTTTELPETETTTGALDTTTTEPQAENIRNVKSDRKTPLFLVVPGAERQRYVTYEVEEFPHEVATAEIVAYPENAAIYTASKLQAVPLSTGYNPYAYFQIYQGF